MRQAEVLPSPDVDRENAVEEALIDAGLHDTEAPRPGTPAYERLVQAAEDYISAIKAGERKPSVSMAGDGENYFSKRKVFAPSDSARREAHNKLSMMLFGSSRKDLSEAEASQVSNFAAYVTGHTEYLNTWRPN